MHLFFQITNHKTAETGPVMLSLSPSLLTMVNNFTQICRHIPDLPRDTTRSIFISWPQEGPCVPMDSSSINKAVQRIWSKGPSEKIINATRIRKATATAVRSVAPQTREVLAKHMSHSTETADRYYALHNQREMARPVGQLIQSVMIDGNFKTQKSVHWPKPKPGIRLLPPCGEKNNSETDEEYNYTEGIDYRTPPCAKKGEIETEEDNNQTEGYENIPSPVYDPNLALSADEDEHKQTHKRRAFSKQEAETLIRLCSTNLESGNLYKSDIMTTVTSTQEGRLLVLKLKDSLAGKDLWKTIVDRVHVERRRRKTHGNRRRTF